MQADFFSPHSFRVRPRCGEDRCHSGVTESSRVRLRSSADGPAWVHCAGVPGVGLPRVLSSGHPTCKRLRWWRWWGFAFRVPEDAPGARCATRASVPAPRGYLPFCAPTRGAGVPVPESTRRRAKPEVTHLARQVARGSTSSFLLPSQCSPTAKLNCACQ